MASPYLLYPENQRFVQGLSSHPKIVPNYNFIGCLYLFFIPFLLGIVLLIGMTGKQTYEQVLLKNAQEVFGIVTERYTRAGSEGTTYYLVYSYQIDGKSYTKRQSVERSLYNDYPVEQSILLKVAVGNHAVAKIAGTDQNVLTIFFIILTAVFTIFIGAVFIFLVQNSIKENKLRRNGRLVWGKIESVSTRKDNDNDYHLELNIHFTSPNTRQNITDKRSYMVNHLRKSPLPDLQTVVAIYYADDELWEVL